MTCFKPLQAALVSVFVISVVAVATTAVAAAAGTPLPDIQTALPGERYPIALSGGGTGSGEVVNEAGGLLLSNGGSILLTASELTSLGQATIDFSGVEEVEEHKCHTEGDSESSGAVLVPGAEYHLVYTGLSPAHTLELAGLISFTKFTTLCNLGAFEITTTGPLTARLSINAPEAGTEGDSTKLEGASHCGSFTTAIQEIPDYYGDGLEEILTTLLLNPSGTGNKKSCLEAGSTLLTVASSGVATMFSVLF